ncbi:MAG TPA: DUF1232 domain-containing protein [Rhizobiales bacterium]|nr:DUF1232 domain-containing protein [Hyphomicrobiales bacterium]
MTKVPDLENETVNLPATVSGNEKTVREGFWPKMARVLARIPFADNAVAAWYCAFDPKTPLRVKGILLAALAYFVMPVDVIPDFLVGIGFTDDMAVLATAISLIKNHIKDEHYEAAREKLAELRDNT